MRLFSVLLCCFLSLFPAAGQTTTSSTSTTTTTTTAAPAASPRALPVTEAELENPQAAPVAVPGGVNIHWYGHGFVYLTSSVGVRAAIDPFGTDTVHYKFPEHLTADFVLVTHEAEDHSAAEQLFGNPLIFRSVTAVGLNRANGIPFHGVALQKDISGNGVSDTAFALTFDGVRFCYLGEISQPLLAAEKDELGQADVLFLPVGLTALSVNDLNQVVEDLRAKVVIPINYRTDYSGILQLRPLEDYLSQTKFPVRRLDSSEMVINRAMLPSSPTIYLLKSP